MLGFFGRYQKGILIVSAFAIIASMAFFGTYSTLDTSKKMKKTYRSQAIDDRRIDESELKAIALFLDADATAADNKGDPLFLLKSNWVARNLLEPKIIHEIFEKYSFGTQKPIQAKIDEHRKFRMYTHPSDPSISLEKSISQFFSDFSKSYETFMYTKEKDFNKDLDSLFSLYRIASKVPMGWMKQILYYEQMQKKGQIEVDRSLEHRDIQIFQAQKLRDWIGVEAVDLLSQWVYNMALFAGGYDSYRGTKGYRVSTKEAEASLRVLVKKNMKRSGNAEKIEISYDQMIDRLAHANGLLRQDLVAGWQKIMLFRRFFHDVGNVIVKPEMFKHLIKDSKLAHLETFELDDSIKSDSFYHVVKLDSYLNELCLRPEQKFKQFAFHDVQDLEKMQSFLLAKNYKVKFSKTTLAQAANEIGLGELIKFQMSEKGFKFMQGHSRLLKACESLDSDSKMSYFERLDDKNRTKLDHLCRFEMLKDQQPLIRDLLVDQPMQGFSFYVTNTDQNQVFDGVFDLAKLGSLLEDSLKNETASQQLFCYSQDDENYYRFELVEASENEILSFSKANEIGVLNALVDKQLRQDYLKLRVQHDELKNADESFKSYAESKDFVASLSYSNLSAAIGLRMEKKGVNTPKARDPAILAKHYFDDFVYEAYQKLKKLEFKPSVSKDSLVEQFALKSAKKIIRQSDKDHDQSLFKDSDNTFKFGFDDFAYIYKVDSVMDDQEQFNTARKSAQVMLANEAKLNAASSVLEKMLKVNVEIDQKKP